VAEVAVALEQAQARANLSKNGFGQGVIRDPPHANAVLLT